MVMHLPPALIQAQTPLEALLAQARSHRDGGRFKEAIQAYDAALMQSPGDAAALPERAQVLSWVGRFSEAEADYRRLRDVHPPSAMEADLGLARLAAWQHRAGAALRLLEPWARQEHRQAVLDAATYEAWDGRLRQAIARIEMWLAAHPGDVEGQLLKAKFLSWAGRKAGAEAVYRERLRVEPSHREARLGLARLALWSEDPERARALWEALPEAEKAHPDSRLLAAQIAAARGQLRRARDLAGQLAKEGRLPQEVRDLRLSLAGRYGPVAELIGSRTDTTDRLRVDELRLRGAVPLFDGSLEAWGTRREVSLPAAQVRPSEVGLGLSQPLGGHFSFTGAAARLQEINGTAWRAGLAWSPHPGVELGLARSLEWATYTPATARLRLAFRTTSLDAGWHPGGGVHRLSASYAFADLSAGSTRKSWSAAYEAKRPFPGLELRGGAMVRGFNYSESLALGFFNPASYRYQGLSGGASLKGGTQWELGGDLRLGRQSVNGEGRTTWSPSLSASFQPAGWGTMFFAAWSKTYAGLPVAVQGDPAEYRETLFRLGLRVRALR